LETQKYNANMQLKKFMTFVILNVQKYKYQKSPLMLKIIKLK
jgi:hypothetical protein